MNTAYNINQPIKKVLIKAYCHENKKRNLLLFASVTLTIVILFCAISILYGKLQMDILNNMRSDGMTVSTYLENGTQNSVLQLKHFSYVKETGIQKKAGKLIKDQQTYSTCVMLDTAAYENMILPALVDVQGTYPQKANEIMLSTKTLNYLGIENYKLGMTISLDFYWNDIFCTTLTGTQDFILSGYYIDLQNTMTEYSASYISEKRLQEACKTLIETSKEPSKMIMFNDSMITQITNTTDINANNISKTEGFFPIVNKQGNESLRILNLNQQNDPLIIIQKLNNDELEELKVYMTKNNITADWNTFVQYNGIFILHNHLIPEYSNKIAADYIGHNIGVYDLVPVGTDMSNYTPFQLINCGYVDIANKDFPELNFLWNKENTIYFIVSNNTFNTLSDHLTKQTFQILFHVQKNKEPEIKNKLKQWIQTTNMEFQSKGYSPKLNLLSIKCNSDTIAANRNYIIITRFIMWTISIVLIFIGIINYFNTMITDIIMRKRELTIMEKIGLTKKQLRHMLTLEGLFYCFIIIGLWGTIGSGILYLIGLYMQSKLSYFIFRYPLELFIAITIALILICVLIPCNIYKINNTPKKAS